MTTNKKYPDYLNDIKPEFKTGDLVLFEGKGLFSTLIKIKTLSKISHVGIILIENGEPVICESTTLSDLPDMDSGEFIKGVQKHPLKERIEKYDGKIWHAPILVDLPNEKAMLNWLDVVHSKKVKYDWKQAFLSGFALKHIVSKENFSLLFCSELCFKALKKAGVIAKRFNASQKNPKDIYNLAFIEEKRKLK